MPPAHVAPLVAEGVRLKKEMVLPVEQDGAVGIVDPVGRRAEVEFGLPGIAAAAAGCWAATLMVNVNARLIATKK